MENGNITDWLEYQQQILPGVSRTFALTIPQLPRKLTTAVTNAYLLCRIADTIEDDVNLVAEDVRRFQARFIRVLKGEDDPGTLVDELSPRLSTSTIAAERELVANMEKVVGVTSILNPSKRDTLTRCVEVMCEQMPMFQRAEKKRGLDSLHDLNHYCYAVAGVVGEMLTELFCSYSDEIAIHYAPLMKLAPSFGQGLQMTNILKDVWEDLANDSCWLPQDIFAEPGYDLSNLSPDYRRDDFCAGMNRLIGIAHGHLYNAVQYSLLIPPRETGIRKFLLWNVNMAVQTLKQIHRHPLFVSAEEVKISRGTLISTILATNAVVRSDSLVRSLFAALGRTVPMDSVDGGYFEEAARLSSF